MTTTTQRADLAKTRELPMVEIRATRTYWSDLECALLCYLADAGSITERDEVTALRASDLATTQALEAVQ